MLLAVDVGNTNISIGLYNDADLVAAWRVGTDPTRTEDEYAALLNSLVSRPLLSLDDVSGFCMSSVVPATVRPMRLFVEKHLSVTKSVILGPDTDLGIAVRYQPPADVGPDRLANAVAAHAKYGGPAIVVDFGTATTFDAIAQNGDYLGGAIAPGIEISLQALFSHAARLQSVEFYPPEKAVGTSTASSLRSGVLFGTASQVDGMCARFAAEIGGKPRIIATGGLADVVAPLCKSIGIVDQMLTLDGLRIIFGRVEG